MSNRDDSAGASGHLSRRNFLKTAGAGASAFTVVPRHVLGGPGHTPPSEKLNIAAIGAGGKGESDVDGVSSENIYALCDVDRRQAAETFADYPDAKQYVDYREMLEAEAGNLDAVTVSTPDHNHAAASIMAMERGLHVFCQKPLTRTIWEARRMAEVAEDQGVATHMGIQGHANDGMREAREWIEAGAIGTVREIHIWTNRPHPYWEQGFESRPREAYHVPEGLDWDLWLGTAPERPYHPQYVPEEWRGWWDYGTGALGDIGCHAMDASFWALQLGSPSRVVAQTTPVSEESPPLNSRIVYTFPARDDRPETKLVWTDGRLAPPRPEALEDDRPWPLMDSGQLYLGDDAAIIAGMYCSNPRILPESRHQEVVADPPEQRYERSIGHYEEFIRAAKGGAPAGANFPDYATPLTENVLLGNLAVRSGRPIEWDSQNMQVTNAASPNQYVRPTYRDGWDEMV